MTLLSSFTNATQKGKTTMKSKVYLFEVTQLIEVIAESYEKAVESLPLYPSGLDGQKYYVKEELVELQERDGETVGL